MASNPFTNETFNKWFLEFYESLDKDLEKITIKHLENRHKTEQDLEQRQQILLAKIKQDAVDQFEKTWTDLTMRVHAGELSSEKQYQEELSKLRDDFLKDMENRMIQSSNVLRKSYDLKRQIEYELKQTQTQLEQWSTMIKEEQVLEEDRQTAQNNINKLKVQEMRLELELAAFKQENELSYSKFQEQLINEEKIKRIKAFQEVEEERKNLLEKGEEEDSVNALISGKKDIIERIFEKNIEKISNPLLRAFTDKGTDALGTVNHMAIEEIKTLNPVLGNILSTLENGFNELRKALKKNVDDAMDTYTKYLGPINTRLQGSGKEFEELIDTMQDNLTTSVYVSQKRYVENLSTLVDKGVAYNLEERALMITLGEKISTTFDALDENLTRLIRLQQADLTRSELGSQASITNFLNTNFNDTSYLSDAYKTINSVLLEATSQMNPDQAMSFSYAVQKWLGALYSVGMSQQAVQSIAQGLSYISTGNVSSLASQPGLQTLLALSASRSGQSLSSMLTSGLTASTVDELLKSMVEYLSDIAKNTSNQVLKAQWADIVNMSVSDLRAISNLTTTDISHIYGSRNLDYSQSREEVRNQLAFISNRTSIQEMLDNAVDNFMFTFGMNIATDTGAYLAFKMEDVADRILSLFDGTTFGSTIGGAIKLVAAGLSAYAMTSGFINTAMDTFESLKNGIFSISLDSWNSTPYNVNNRGEAYLGLTGPVVTKGLYDLADTSSSIGTAVSSSTSVTAMGIEATKNFSDVEQKVVETGKTISGQNEETNNTLDKLYNMLFEKQSIPIKVTLDSASDDVLAEFFKIIATNTDTLSSDIERYTNNSSTSVQNLINLLYSVRSS